MYTHKKIHYDSNLKHVKPRTQRTVQHHFAHRASRLNQIRQFAVDVDGGRQSHGNVDVLVLGVGNEVLMPGATHQRDADVLCVTPATKCNHRYLQEVRYVMVHEQQ